MALGSVITQPNSQLSLLFQYYSGIYIFIKLSIMKQAVINLRSLLMSDDEEVPIIKEPPKE